MKILGINSSGRTGGNNYHILNSCLETFEKKSHTTELIQLKDLAMEGCRSCYGCKKDASKCIIEDDMADISKKVMESDLLVVGMPLNMWQITSLAKAFMERLYPFYHFNGPSDLKGKKLILIFTQATQDEKMFESYFEHIKQAMCFLGFDVIQTVVCTGLRQPADYLEHPEILDKITSIADC